MIGKDLKKITEEDMKSLVDNFVLEGKTIEYKSSLPGKSDGDKKEFLADVSSFANASGGDIVFGILEDPGTREPKTLEGLKIDNVDQEINRLDNIIREGIEPRIPSVNIQSVGLANGRTAIIIRVGKSWVSPHRVIFKGHDKFYSRSSNGKYPIDVEELRIVFTLSETMTQRIRKFTEERIARLYANETPVPFIKNPKTVLHLVSIGSFAPGNRYDIEKVWKGELPLPPIYSKGHTGKHTLEGYMNYYETDAGEVSSYAHLYRNGIIEAVEGTMLVAQEGLIPGIAFENEIIKAFLRYMNTLNKLEVELPLFAFLSLLEIKGYNMYIDNSIGFRNDTYPIDRDILLLPEIVIEKYDSDAAKILKPAFDALWNACGQPRSRGYDDEGERVR